MKIGEFWERLREEVRKSQPDFPTSLLSDEALGQLSEDLLECNITMRNLIKEARSLSLPIALCTNNTEFWMKRLDQRFKIQELFDSVLISYERGAVKPSPVIIEMAARSLQLELNSIAFIDDREENCRSAARLGLQPILFRSAKTLRSTLRGFGLPLRSDDSDNKWVKRL
jgi:putative hydrolase of the HAD superfamily